MTGYKQDGNCRVQNVDFRILKNTLKNFKYQTLLTVSTKVMETEVLSICNKNKETKDLAQPCLLCSLTEHNETTVACLLQEEKKAHF